MKQKILYIYLLLQPFIDLITALMTRNEMSLTLGIVVRMIALGVIIFYTLISKSKYKKYAIGYYLLMFIFLIFYFLTKDLNMVFFKEELRFIFKYLYFPILLVGLLTIYDELKLDKEKITKIFTINLVVFFILIIIPFILGTGFASYVGNRKGTVGWFYAANEVSAIICILFPYLIMKIKQYTLPNVIYLILGIFTSFIIGTKTAYLMIMLPMICIIFYSIIKKQYKKVFVPIVLILSLVVLYPISPLKYNIEQGSVEAEAQGRTGNRSFLYSLFSGRDDLLTDTAKIYFESNDINKYFGIGMSNRDDINDEKVYKYIEMDFFDILFRMGVVGAFIFYLPIMVIFMICIEHVLKKKLNLELDEYLILYSSCVGILASVITGHVLGAPAVSIYLALSLIFSLQLKKDLQ